MTTAGKATASMVVAATLVGCGMGAGKPTGQVTLTVTDRFGTVPVGKVVSANGRPAEKISDNPTKATGPNTEISRYMRVFDVEAQPVRDVVV